MTDPVECSTDTAEESRIKAEARRKRILEKSKDRMKTVSGEQSKAPDDELSTAQSSGSSRMAAMRRRRYQKKVDDAKTEEGDISSKENCDDTVAPEIKDEPLTVADTFDAVNQEPEAQAVPEPVVTVTPKIEPSSEDLSEKRKYKGVAAVRRQKAIEKQQKEAESTPSAVASVVPIRKKPPVNVFPIIMHMITIVILLAVGFDVGYQQEVHPTVTVHRQLAPHQHGIGVLNAFRRSTAKDPKDILLESEAEWSPAGAQDEFNTIADEVYEPNVDPLFNLDLDLITKGDGILFMLARGAVACHRALLQLCYYLPLKIFSAVMLIPKKLLATPPVLALVAIVVRQTAKRVFGAGLPIPEKETAKEDVLGMLKNGVMTFLSSSFPTVVGLYDAFTHLTADMFVMLCGVFMGLACTHHWQDSEIAYGSGKAESNFGTDEL